MRGIDPQVTAQNLSHIVEVFKENGVVVLLAGTIFLLEMTSGKRTGTASFRLFRTFLRVPPVFGIAAGVIANPPVSLSMLTGEMT